AGAVRMSAHTLKSGSADVGAWELSQICAELEAMGRDGALDGAAELMARAEAVYPLVQTALEDVRQEALAHNFKPRDDDHDS
ncbi:MAG: Hpt domain-containing protein, partial [Anaerolineae bacterium]|nr:Hpt domain-containing protein [Anaerolineae bacterium]